MYSYSYALIQKSEFGPLIARVKPRRGMLVTTNGLSVKVTKILYIQ